MKIQKTSCKNTPLVSILMPVYNAAPYLEDAINSIQNQTLRNWELLVVDDASTDGSETIVKDAAKYDKRIKLFQNKINQGLVKSLNTAIPFTHGKYVARMDADDISLPSRLQKQVRFLQTNPSLVACGAQELIINKSGDTIAYKYFPTNPDTCYRMIANFMVIQPPLLMAHGDVFRSLRYDNHIFKNDDISMHFKLLQHGSFSNVDEVLFKYRKRTDSITHKNPRNVFFLALRVRLNVITKHQYKISIPNAVMLIAETVIVGLLPNAVLITLFELMRHKKSFHINIPKYTFAKLKSYATSFLA